MKDLPQNIEEAQRLLEVPHCASQVLIEEPIMLFLDADGAAMEIVQQTDGSYAKRGFKPCDSY